MTFYKYTNEPEYVKLYGRLLESLYLQCPDYGSLRFDEFNRNINNKNPFIKHGSFQNFIFVKDSEPVAHICVVLNDHGQQEVGIVGYFDCINDVTVAKEVFATVIEFLKERGMKIILGPIQFTTWQSFRVAASGNSSPFFSEPYNPDYYRNLFENSGFSVVQNSISRVRDIARDGISMVDSEYKRLLSQNFSFDRVSRETASAAMREIYTITSAAFRDTLAFTPISFEEFEYQYCGIEKIVEESVIFVVRNPKGLSVAFCLAVPDMLNKNKKRLVIKTIGVLPGYQDRGIGRAVLYITELAGMIEGYTSFIYSTMRIDNKKIHAMTSETKDVLRTYSVYELKI